EIGPYCVIGPNVSIGEGCRLAAHVYVAGHTAIGARTVVAPFASLGTPPQSVKYRGGPTRPALRAGCHTREERTINTRPHAAAAIPRLATAASSPSARTWDMIAASETTSPWPTTPCSADT